MTFKETLSEFEKIKRMADKEKLRETINQEIIKLPKQPNNEDVTAILKKTIEAEYEPLEESMLIREVAQNTNLKPKEIEKQITHLKKIEKEEIRQNKKEWEIDEKRDETEKSLVVNDFLKRVYEEIYRNETVKFVYMNDSHVKETPDAEGIKPIEDEALKKSMVLLPEKAEEYESTEKLIQEIKQHINKYLDVGEEYLQYATYYILLSWVHDRLNTVPYLRVLGDTGSGKSRFLDVIGRICYKPIIITGAVTPAPIYRLQEKWHGTLVIDEADRRQSDTADEIIKILNCGFERGRPVARCNKESPNDVEVHDVFGTKVISSRYTFYDKALESRCITHVIQQTSREDMPPVLPPSYYVNEKKIRNKLLMFRLKNYFKITQDILEPDKINALGLEGIEPRLKQTASPFFVLFTDEALKKEFITFLIEYQKKLIDERAESLEGQIILALKELWKNKENLTSKDITLKVNEEMTEKEKTNVRKVGRVLKSLGFSSKSIFIDNKTYRIISKDWNLFKKLLQRYDIEFDKETLRNYENYVYYMGGLEEKKNILQPDAKTPETNVISDFNVINVMEEPVLDEKPEVEDLGGV